VHAERSIVRTDGLHLKVEQQARLIVNNDRLQMQKMKQPKQQPPAPTRAGDD
jgi:hypothetical protein